MNNLYRETGKYDEDAPVVRGTSATPKVGFTGFVSAPSAVNVFPSLAHILGIPSTIGVLGVSTLLRILCLHFLPS